MDKRKIINPKETLIAFNKLGMKKSECLQVVAGLRTKCDKIGMID